jgi:hypothetical protein
MTNPIPTDWRALCAELLLFAEQAGEIAANESLWPKCDPDCSMLDRTAAALAQPEPQGPMPEVDDILRLAEIIREVDGNHDKGAAALAEAILSHPDSRWQHAQPLEDPGDACARIELVVALHCLASHFEIACTYLSGDDLTKARGDIAHALSIARKHNQNGPGCPTTPPPGAGCGAVAGAGGLRCEGEVLDVRKS